MTRPRACPWRSPHSQSWGNRCLEPYCHALVALDRRAEVLRSAAVGNLYREVLARLRGATEPSQQVAHVEHLTRHAYESLSAKLELLRGVGTVASAHADTAQTIDDRRWQHQEKMVEVVAERGVLPAGVVRTDATDVLWALTSSGLYQMLVLQRGWSPEHYASWLTLVITAQIGAPR